MAMTPAAIHSDVSARVRCAARGDAPVQGLRIRRMHPEGTLAERLARLESVTNVVPTPRDPRSDSPALPER